MTTLEIFRLRYIRKIISDKNYTTSRAYKMNNHIQYWRESYNRANTRKARNFCNTMINMYLKRYTFYVTENLRNTKSL